MSSVPTDFAVPDLDSEDSSATQSVSATVPDWSREHVRFGRWDPARALLKSLRDYQRYRARRSMLWVPCAVWAVLRHRFWSVVTGADIPLNCQIAGGLLLPHPNGVVIHPNAVIGPNCILFQQTTLASTRNGAPRLGGHVDIGAGAKVLGPVTLGDHSRVGANAVVVKDVPAGTTVAGVPAKVIGIRPARD